MLTAQTNTATASLPFPPRVQPSQNPKEKPAWLKVGLPTGTTYHALKERVAQSGIATVCQEAQCPNIGECWGGGTATFMVMGDTCTRGCRFCNVKTGNPKGWLDTQEPENLGLAIDQAGWQYVVLTSVDRDDLPDGGAAHLAECIRQIQQHAPTCKTEVLIPDFGGDTTALQALLAANPLVVAHNMETVERLTPTVRDRRATYAQSLTVLRTIKQLAPTTFTKTSIMLGLGETSQEIHATLADLQQAGVDIITFGQYLQPTPKHLAVDSYVHPEEFAYWQQVATQHYGFLFCASGALVRSSYRAGELFMANVIKESVVKPLPLLTK